MQPITFAIVKKNYITGKASVMTVHTDKMNARFDIESFVVDYIVQKDGQDNAASATVDLSGKVLEKREFARVRARDSLPEGHYIVVHCAPERDSSKMTIWRKYSETTKATGFWGWWGSTQTATKWRKVLSLHIVSFDEWKPNMSVNTPAITVRRKWRAAMRIADDVNSVDLTARKAFAEKLTNIPVMQAIRELLIARDAEVSDRIPDVEKARAANPSIRDPTATPEDVAKLAKPMSVIALRAKFPADFMSCPAVGRVAEPAELAELASTAETVEDELRASILQRCTQVGDNINIVETAPAPTQ